MSFTKNLEFILQSQSMLCLTSLDIPQRAIDTCDPIGAIYLRIYVMDTNKVDRSQTKQNQKSWWNIHCWKFSAEICFLGIQSFSVNLHALKTWEAMVYITEIPRSFCGLAYPIYGKHRLYTVIICCKIITIFENICLRNVNLRRCLYQTIQISIEVS